LLKRQAQERKDKFFIKRNETGSVGPQWGKWWRNWGSSGEKEASVLHVNGIKGGGDPEKHSNRIESFRKSSQRDQKPGNEGSPHGLGTPGRMELG